MIERKIKIQIFSDFYFSSYGQFCDVITPIFDEYMKDTQCIFLQGTASETFVNKGNIQEINDHQLACLPMLCACQCFQCQFFSVSSVSAFDLNQLNTVNSFPIIPLW